MKRTRISKAHYLCQLNVDREIVAVLGFNAKWWIEGGYRDFESYLFI